MSSRFVVQVPGREPQEAHIEEHDQGYVIVLGEQRYTIDVRGGTDSPTRSLIVDGEAFESATFRDKDDFWDVFVLGDVFRVQVKDALWAQAESESAVQGAGETVRSPMPGTVVKILVSEGDVVPAGQPVIVVEAMKMQNELSNLTPGVVRNIAVKEGDTVDEDAALLEIEPESKDAP